MRLNKYLSETGLCSRREADRWIEEGRVQVNGVRAGLGVQVGLEDEVWVDGRPVKARPERVILAYNKPRGVECTTDLRIPENIVSAVGYSERVFPIGRLDKFSEGLILLTNDGDIVNRILRSHNGHEKEYWVELDEALSLEQKRQLERGVELDDGRGLTKRCVIQSLGPRAYRMILTEGRNRQIRKMAELIGRRVVLLRRVRVLHIRLGDLPPGKWRLLTTAELAELDTRLAHSVPT